ncbi:unnamed protein product, partial [Polarella glacialis]
LKVTLAAPQVLHVELHRPDKLNAFDLPFWEEIRSCFGEIADDAEVRAVLLSGAGRFFTAGLDLSAAVAVTGATSAGELDVARKALHIRKLGKAWQDAFSNIERCGKAVIACMHGGVVGAGLEMTSACDIRFCTEDAYFQAAEVDIGIAADVGGCSDFRRLSATRAWFESWYSRVVECHQARRCSTASFLGSSRTRCK